MAEGIESEWLRAEALARVVESLTQIGDREGAREALQKALTAVEAIRVERRRAEALAKVTGALALVEDRENLQKALSAVEAIESEWWRVKALAGVAKALAQVTMAQDRAVAAWTAAAFRHARARGREDVWHHIAAFAPVLAKLGVISETWDRIQAVERVLSGMAV